MNKEHLGMLEDKKFVDLKNSKDRDRFYRKFTDEQRLLFESIRDNIFTYVEAKAGCAKTSTTMSAMVDLLANNEIDKIIYIQKPSQRYLSQGYLPGDIDTKCDLLWGAFYDAMLDLGISPDMITTMINNNQIELTTNVSLRGINISNSGVIIDEGQNIDYQTIKLIFTRCHDDCHIVLLGDKEQKDNRGINTYFVEYGKYLSSSGLGNKCVLTRNFRGKFSKLAEDFTKKD